MYTPTWPNLVRLSLDMRAGRPDVPPLASEITAAMHWPRGGHRRVHLPGLEDDRSVGIEVLDASRRLHPIS